ncbi:MAG: MBOAT family protein [Oscillospiraceae bacterium]|nr:MBOAT family protein [Oscillospiraceae bacterium]
MSFTSLEFCIFLPIVFGLYYLSPKRSRWVILLAASYVFYGVAGIQYILLLAYVTAAAFLAARYLEKAERIGKWCMLICVCAVILPLIVFKYTGFLTENLNILLRAVKSAESLTTMQIIQPLGISFYSFSALGYVIDVARKKSPAIQNPLHLAAGIAFFPCLVSGPIERQNRLVPQIVEGNAFDYAEATYGLKQIAWGLFEKRVLADNLAVYVDTVYTDVHAYFGAPLLIASLFYTLMIYCDFAGYSDMAIGTARLFGIRLTKNFDSPYFSESFSEFWRRWHISLSSWLRDYVYIPLGGSRRGKARKALNILITMLVSGIWHGASWTFVAWGGLHGLAQAAESMLGLNGRTSKNRLVRIIRTAAVFSVCSALWVFFRAPSFADASYLLRHMFDGIRDFHVYLYSLVALGLTKPKLAVIAIELAVLAIYDFCSLKTNVINRISALPPVIRWGIYVCFLFLIAQCSLKGTAVQFVYAGF